MHKRLFVLSIVLAAVLSMMIVLSACEGNDEPMQPDNPEIELRYIDVPVPKNNQVYDGKEKNIDIMPSEDYAVIDGGSGTNAGDYIATIRLQDRVNTRWSDGTVGDKQVVWKIEKAYFDSAVLAVEDIEVVADGDRHRLIDYIDISQLPVGISLEIRDAKGNKLDEDELEKDLPGKYSYVLRFCDEGNNYNEISDINVSMTIVRREIDLGSIRIHNTYDYELDDSFEPVYRTVSVDNLPEGVSVREVIGESQCNVGEYDVRLVFDLDPKLVPYTEPIEDMSVKLIIKPIEFDMSVLFISDQTVIYDGKPHRYELGGLPEIDGISVSLTSSAEYTASGDYDVNIVVTNSEGNKNYLPFSQVVSVRLIITPVTVQIPNIKTEYEYCGVAIDIVAENNLDISLYQVKTDRVMYEEGEYVITLSLRDSSSTAWSDGSTRDISIKCRVVKR